MNANPAETVNALDPVPIASEVVEEAPDNVVAVAAAVVAEEADAVAELALAVALVAAAVAEVPALEILVVVGPNSNAVPAEL